VSSNPKIDRSAFNVTEAWKDELKKGGYEPPAMSLSLKIKLTFLSRTWRRILKYTGLKLSKQTNVLEFGCGGGAQLVPLFSNGWLCVGIDCSEEVLSRAQQYVNQVVDGEFLRSDKGRIAFICDDFLNYTNDNLFDMTCQFGVLEHFLNDEERLRYLQKMFDLTKPGGFVVSSVPNGEHLFRAKQKALGLGGYIIPEIDYTVESLKKEMIRCGASSIRILTHDLMGYRKIRYEKGFHKLIDLAIYLIWQIPLFQTLPLYLRRRHAYWLIAIGKK
jgi:SAM-dependent methyltransferase